MEVEDGSAHHSTWSPSLGAQLVTAAGPISSYLGGKAPVLKGMKDAGKAKTTTEHVSCDHMSADVISITGVKNNPEMGRPSVIADAGRIPSDRTHIVADSTTRHL